jgi:phasin family protein
MERIMSHAKTASYAKDFAPFLADLKLPHVDVDSVVASHRKNVETLIEANRCALEGARAVAQRQAELMREGFEKASEVAAEAMAPTAPEKKLAWGTEIAKDAFETGLANYKELFGLATKTGEEVLELMTKRIAASFDEFKVASKGVAESVKDTVKETAKK